MGWRTMKVVRMIGCVDERGRQPRAACPGRQHNPLTRFGDLWVAFYSFGCAVTCRPPRTCQLFSDVLVQWMRV